MSCSPRSDPVGHFVVLESLPECDVHTLKHQLETLAGTEPANPVRGVLWDLRPLRTLPSSQEVRELATFAARNDMLGGRPLALVTASPAVYGLANMFATLAGFDGGVARAFSDYEAARAWLVSGPGET